ncbi:hypothetical protein MJT46_000833 [Ovis ammon polii x Ovis aries]|nr:hypothetical protein MJT46_000833 [Ovis ammon polii x Ovis aries]
MALSYWGSSQSIFIAIVLAEQLQEPQVTIQSVNMSENASCTITLTYHTPAQPRTLSARAAPTLSMFHSSVQIVQLKMEHTGIYHAYVSSNATVASVKHIDLCIYRSAPAFSSSQAEASVNTPGYEKLDTLPKTARHASESSSDSNGTTEEDEERTGMHQPVNGRDRICDSVTKEEAGLDLDSEGQAEYDLVTPDDMAPALVVEGETVYTHVFLNLQGEDWDPKRNLLESKAFYCHL